MSSLFREIRFAARQLRKSSGFAAVAMMTLALGIGVNTAIFSVVEAVMLQPLPYPDPEKLLFFHETNGQYASVSPANLADYNASRSLTGVAHVGDLAMNLTGNGAPERIFGTRVTWNFFRVIGVNPARGHAFTAADDRFGAPHVVILGDEFWRSRYGADPQILGKAIQLDGQRYQVAGIMPPGFISPEQFTMAEKLQFYVPACFTAEELSERGSREDEAIARLTPGVSLSQARAEFAGISKRLAKAYPATMAEYRVALSPARSKLAQSSRTSLLVLLSAVFVILLIACANVANLLLARSVGQRREIAIRLAIGSRRSRILRELLMQTGLLASGGCVAGLICALWIDRGLMHLAPGTIPRLHDAGLNFPVLVFAILICGGTVLLFGLAPAWLASGADPQLALHGSSARHSAGANLLRWRGFLMAGEIALSLVLLVGAGLMLKSFMLLRGVNLGFQPDRVLTMNISVPQIRQRASSGHYDGGSTKPPKPELDPESVRRFQFFDRLVKRTKAIPGVALAAFGRFPLHGHWTSSYNQEERSTGAHAHDYIILDSQMCSLDYFRTLGIPLVEGRAFTEDDRQGSEPVIIVNRAFERKYYPGSTALGHRIRRTGAPDWRRIIGVVADAHYYGQDRETQPAGFFAAAQLDAYPVPIADFAVKSALPLTSLVPAIREAVWSIDPNQPITRIQTLTESVSKSQSSQRFEMTLLLAFGFLALMLAVIGIYGVVAYGVQQRTGEIGIRMALGAQQGSILGMVVRQAMGVAGIGVVIGLAAAWGLSRFVASLLYSVRPMDVVTYLSVVLILVLAAACAAWIPARHASQINPLNALRHE